MTRLLDKKEATRLGSKSGASEVKQHKWFAKMNWGLLRNSQPPVRQSFFLPSSVFGGHSGAASAGQSVAFALSPAAQMHLSEGCFANVNVKEEFGRRSSVPPFAEIKRRVRTRQSGRAWLWWRAGALMGADSRRSTAGGGHAAG